MLLKFIKLVPRRNLLVPLRYAIHLSANSIKDYLFKSLQDMQPSVEAE